MFAYILLPIHASTFPNNFFLLSRSPTIVANEKGIENIQLLLIFILMWIYVHRIGECTGTLPSKHCFERCTGIRDRSSFYNNNTNTKSTIIIFLRVFFPCLSPSLLSSIVLKYTKFFESGGQCVCVYQYLSSNL